MISKLDLAPISINPQQIQKQPSSPINFLYGKNKQYKQSLIKKTQFLKEKLNQLSGHVQSKKKHGKVIDKQLEKQNEKIQYWKNNFDQIQKDYSEKVQKLYRLKEQVNFKPTLRMKCDQQEFQDSNQDILNTLRQKQINEQKKIKQKILLKAMSTRKRQSVKAQNSCQNDSNSFQRIKSIIMAKKTIKRGKNLSLTHLHKKI